jgi:hypothetical protein
MRARVLIAGLCVLVALGCARRAKKPAATDEPVAQNPAPKAGGPKDKADEPNWLTDPRFKKDGEPGSPAAPGKGPSATGKSDWGVSPPQGGWQGGAPGAPPQPPVQPPPGANPPPLVVGGGTPLGAAGRVVALAEMKDVHIFMENASVVDGKMPKPSAVYEALVAAGSKKAAEHVRLGSIVLTGATQRESIWAYDYNALTNGGLAVSQNGVETLTAAELKQRLGK